MTVEDYQSLEFGASEEVPGTNSRPWLNIFCNYICVSFIKIVVIQVFISSVTQFMEGYRDMFEINLLPDKNYKKCERPFILMQDLQDVQLVLRIVVKVKRQKTQTKRNVTMKGPNARSKETFLNRRISTACISY